MGLNKIVSQILDDADKEALEAVKKAQDEAARILTEAKAECGKLKAEGAEKRDALSVAYEERLKSAAELKKRQAVLFTKQQVISEMLDKAYETLIAKEANEYFVLIRKMLEKFVLAKQGEIYFSEKDLQRLPAAFEAEIESTAAAKGGSLKLIKESKNIDGGFILVYGGVEENCSFKALFSAKKDELSDKVHEILFS